MSTKTNFKRIALVAVAALGLGVLSSVPSQATVSGLTVTTANGTAALGGNYDSTTAATVTVSGLLDAVTDSVTVTYFSKSIPTGASANAGHLRFIDSTTAATASSTKVDTSAVSSSAVDNYRIASGGSANSLAIKLDSVSANNSVNASTFRLTPGTAGFVGASFRMELDSATLTAGTYTYTVVVKSFSNGATNAASVIPVTSTSYDVSIVVSALATSSATATATYGFANLSSTSISDGASSTADASLNVSATGGTIRGYLFVAVRNAANGYATAEDSLTATVTGGGLVCSEASTCGKSLSKIAVTGDYQFTLQGDGTGGASTVTVTSGVTGASYVKQLTYYAAAAKTLTATAFTPNLVIGTNDSAVSVVATDAAGTTWGGAAYIYASTAADATAVGGSATTPVACSFLASKNIHYCPITTTAVGTGKFKVIDASTVALATATSAEVTVTSKLSIPSNVKVAFNKSTYAPYEKAYITVTPVDAAGAKLPGGTYTNLLATGGVISSTAFHTGSAAITTAAGELGHVSPVVDAYAGTDKTGGDETYVVYMPASGTVTITWTGGTSLPLSAQVKGTASASVTDPGTAALAAVTALATTVASLKTLITTLTNLVLKIQKKVKA